LNRTFLIIEDHLLFAQALSGLVSAIGDMECIEILTKGSQAVQSVQQKKPDIILLDLNLPDVNGIDVIIQLRNAGITSPVLVISMIIDAFIVSKAMEAGANGFVPKNTSMEELKTAITDLLDGKQYLPDFLLKEISLQQSNSDRTFAGKKPTVLSKRELEILTLISKGMTNKEISEKLFLSPLTVKTHRNNILNKLELKNTAALVSYASSLGLI
jgi:DNA-binding NarL/FixJ family response regulator